jgi:hypothetical protein
VFLSSCADSKDSKGQTPKRKPPKQLQIGIIKEVPDCNGTVEFGDEVEVLNCEFVLILIIFLRLHGT